MSLLGLHRAGSGPTLVWLHGFTQSRDSAHRFRSILAGTYEVLTIDLPGHGANGEVTANLDETADLVAAAVPDERFVLGGYSLGGRVALHLALRHGERLDRLLLLSASAGLADDGARAARRARDERLAQRVAVLGAEAFLDEWLAQPMFADLPPDGKERAARSAYGPGLASSLRHAGTGTQRWLVPDLASVAVPTLVIAGERDEKFVGEARVLAGAMTNAGVRTIEGVGHAAHLEDPVAVARTLAQPQ